MGLHCGCQPRTAAPEEDEIIRPSADREITGRDIARAFMLAEALDVGTGLF
jgi:hypothetical protein